MRLFYRFQPIDPEFFVVLFEVRVKRWSGCRDKNLRSFIATIQFIGFPGVVDQEDGARLRQRGGDKMRDAGNVCGAEKIEDFGEENQIECLIFRP
jgi:hypothetical protein